ncbi:SAM-dependent methyltransferase [Hyphomicrobium sp.]|uniref:class I SAM-dependent methyltransferase n=1 Tax=Hyphomicrobium sp. TaxID=82 RepID=UPI002D7805E3|nr:SAM-dependent methyltransferase [Hyphomicrobium sp.]HET6387893.1 SAM-dependent methyltransferase [Hyphomicrobium sp.]
MADGKDHGVASGAVRSDDVMKRDGDAKQAFMTALSSALNDGSFAKLTLGKFRGPGEASKAVATLVMLKDAPHLKVVTSFPRKDETKTYKIEEGLRAIGSLIGDTYMSATLFSTARDVRLDYSRKGVPHLAVGKATLKSAQPAAHDRKKDYLVPPDRPYLKALQVADSEGRIKPSMQGKYRQICRFIELADDLIKDSELRGDAPLTVIDIGSGKGYLTFAFYDHVTTQMGRRCQMTGIEMRPELVDLCNRLARDLDFDGLSFVAEEASRASPPRADIIIALHACDTATDDAMALGVRGKASLILSAPCCQHEIAPQVKDTGEGLQGLIKFPLLKQRQADLVTDAARALLLEASGYKVKMIEFVSTEHTSKNILIAAVKSSHADRVAARAQYQALKSMTGFSTQHLESQLKDAE